MFNVSYSFYLCLVISLPSILSLSPAPLMDAFGGGGGGGGGKGHLTP